MMRRRLITLGIVVAIVNGIIGPLMYVLRDGDVRDHLFGIVAYSSIAAAILMFVFMLFDRKTNAAIIAHNTRIFGGQIPSHIPSASDVFDENLRVLKAAGFAGAVAQLLFIEFILAMLTTGRAPSPPPPLALAAIGLSASILSSILNIGEHYQGEVPPRPKITTAGWIALVVLAIPAIFVAALLVHFVRQ